MLVFLTYSITVLEDPFCPADPLHLFTLNQEHILQQTFSNLCRLRQVPIHSPIRLLFPVAASTPLYYHALLQALSPPINWKLLKARVIRVLLLFVS